MSTVNTEVASLPGGLERTEELEIAPDRPAHFVEPEPLEPAEAHEPVDPAPVFVDVTGRRRKLLKPLAILAALLCCGYVTAVAVSLLAGSDTPFTPWTGIVSTHHVHGAKGTKGTNGGTAIGGSRSAAGRTGSTPSPVTSGGGPSATPRASSSTRTKTSASPSTAGSAGATATPTTTTSASATATTSAGPTATTTHGNSSGKGKAHAKG